MTDEVYFQGSFIEGYSFKKDYQKKLSEIFPSQNDLTKEGNENDLEEIKKVFDDNNNGNKNGSCIIHRTRPNLFVEKITQTEPEKVNEETIAKTVKNVVPKNKKPIFIARIKDFSKKKRKRKEHSKLSYDNMIQKMRGKYLNSVINLLNVKYGKMKVKQGVKKNCLFLKKLKFVLYKSSRADKNAEFLESIVKDFLSKPISDIYDGDKDYNKKNIENFFENLDNYEGGEEISEILLKTFEDIRNMYINGDFKEEGFFIEYDLVDIRKKVLESKKKNNLDIDDYICKLKEIFMRFPEK